MKINKINIEQNIYNITKTSIYRKVDLLKIKYLHKGIYRFQNRFSNSILFYTNFKFLGTKRADERFNFHW